MGVVEEVKKRMNLADGRKDTVKLAVRQAGRQADALGWRWD